MVDVWNSSAKGGERAEGVGKARVGILVFLELLMIERWIMW